MKNFYKSANIENWENISMIDRFVLLCLMLGVEGDSDISTISMEKISEYCSYTDEDGIFHHFGWRKVRECLGRLERANRIKIIYPEKKGQCTKYKILLPEHYEKVSIEFCKQNLSPIAKGYILCNLQHNLNKFEDTKQPNNIDTLCQYNIDVMKDQFSDSSGKIRRAEKELVDKGILTLNDTTKKYKNGFPITERILHLDKVQLGRFVVESILDHEQRISNNEHEIDQLKTYMNSILEFVATLDPEKVQKAIENLKK